MPLFLTAEPAEVVRVALAEALDLVDFGVVLLNPAMQPRFLNRHFVTMWAVPDELLASGTTFRQLLDHLGNNCAYQVLPADLVAYIDQREGAVRDGTVAPAVIDLTDGGGYSSDAPLPATAAVSLPTSTSLGRSRNRISSRMPATPPSVTGSSCVFPMNLWRARLRISLRWRRRADAAARLADAAKRRLEHEMTEQQELEAQLRRMATTDALTGAINPAQLLTLGQRELERVRAMGQELAVVMLDIDHFKSINDRYGRSLRR